MRLNLSDDAISAAVTQFIFTISESGKCVTSGPSELKTALVSLRPP